MAFLDVAPRGRTSSPLENLSKVLQSRNISTNVVVVGLLLSLHDDF